MALYRVHPAKATASAGFSLIELMVVLVILGLLVSLVAVNVLPQADKAKVKAAYTQIKLFEDALEMYRLDHGGYPATDEGLSALAKGGFIKDTEIPKDPWGNVYKYTKPGAGGAPFDIVSYGADGASGGSGFDADVSNHQAPASGNSDGKAIE